MLSTSLCSCKKTGCILLWGKRMEPMARIYPESEVSLATHMDVENAVESVRKLADAKLGVGLRLESMGYSGGYHFYQLFHNNTPISRQWLSPEQALCGIADIKAVLKVCLTLY
jgi:hypothetical protein